MNSRIKDRRLQLGMTLEEVAGLCGVGKSTVRKWENGIINDIGSSKIVSLAKALNVSPMFILNVSEAMGDNIGSFAPKDEKSTLSLKEQEHLNKYRSLDNKGKHTVDTVLEMEYLRCKSNLELNAAHAIEGATQEDHDLDDDIMNDDKFWD